MRFRRRATSSSNTMYRRMPVNIATDTSKESQRRKEGSLRLRSCTRPRHRENISARKIHSEYTRASANRRDLKYVLRAVTKRGEIPPRYFCEASRNLGNQWENIQARPWCRGIDGANIIPRTIRETRSRGVSGPQIRDATSWLG